MGVPRRRLGPPHLLGNRRAGVESRVLKKQPAAWERRGPSSQVENEGLCSSTDETSDRGGRLHESRQPPAARKGKDAPASLSLTLPELAPEAWRLRFCSQRTTRSRSSSRVSAGAPFKPGVFAAW